MRGRHGRGTTSGAWIIGVLAVFVGVGSALGTPGDHEALEEGLARVAPAYCEAVVAAVRATGAAAKADPAASLRDAVDPAATEAARNLLGVLSQLSDEALKDHGAVTICGGRDVPALTLAAEAAFVAGAYAPGCLGASALGDAFRRAGLAFSSTGGLDAARLLLLSGAESLRCSPDEATARAIRRHLPEAASALADSLEAGPAANAAREVPALLSHVLAAARDASDTEAQRALRTVIRSLTSEPLTAKVAQADPAAADRIAAIGESTGRLSPRGSSLVNSANLLADPGRVATADDVVTANRMLREAIATAPTAQARSEARLARVQLLQGELGASLGTDEQRAIAVEQELAAVLREDPTPPAGVEHEWAAASAARLAIEGGDLPAAASARLRLRALTAAPAPLPVDLLAARLDLMDEAGLPLPDAIHDTWREIQSRGLLAEACRVGLVDRMLAWLPARTNPYLHAEIDEQSRPLRQATAPTLTAGE